MSRPNWTTVAIPDNLYEEIKQRHVPARSKSVAAYVHFWVRVGLLIDAAMDVTDDKAGFADRVLQSLQALDREAATENRE